MSSYTRCPQCDTAFIVREVHLQVAGGNVRCGSCKSIFNANNYMLQLDDNEADISLIDNPESEINSPESEIESPESEIDSPAEGDLEVQEDLIYEASDKTDAGLSYNDSHTNESNKETEFQAVVQSENTSMEIGHSDSQDTIALSLDHVEQIPESESVINEHDSIEDYVQIDMRVELNVEPSSEIELSEDANYEVKDDADLFVESLDNLQLAETDPDTRNSVVEDFVNSDVISTPMFRKILWISSGLIVLMLITTVIFWVNRIELAKDNNWRPTIDKICKYIDCGIPERRDIRKITLQNREVSYGEASITVNLLLINTALFEQRYPQVEIKFSDLDGNVLITHLVLPAEYLRIELIDSLIPVNIPVHIEFTLPIDTEIVVGYEFKFL